MTNYEKRKEELETFFNNYPLTELAISKNTDKIDSCNHTLCIDCIFQRPDLNCELARIEWAAQEFKPKKEKYFSVGKKAYLVLNGEIHEGTIIEMGLTYNITDSYIIFEYEEFCRMIKTCDIGTKFFLNKENALKAIGIAI